MENELQDFLQEINTIFNKCNNDLQTRLEKAYNRRTKRIVREVEKLQKAAGIKPNRNHGKQQGTSKRDRPSKQSSRQSSKQSSKQSSRQRVTVPSRNTHRRNDSSDRSNRRNSRSSDSSDDSYSDYSD